MPGLQIRRTVCLAFFLVSVAGPSRAAYVNGRNYLGLAEWARANSFVLRAANHGDEITLTNRGMRLKFDVDSSDAEVNGIKLRLSFPAAKLKDQPMIAQFDLDSAIRPLMPSQRPTEKKITTICIDPGHGGKDKGEQVGSLFGHSEKTYTLALALELRQQLLGAGFKVVMTRTTDSAVRLPERAELANSSGADLFVCLHFNAWRGQRDQVQGVETYCITPIGAASSNDHSDEGKEESVGAGPTAGNRNEQRSLRLAFQVQKSLVEGLGANDRGIKRARFRVLRDTNMPGILIEGGFMTHPVEGRRIYSAVYRRQMAAQIVRGILNYQKPS